MKVAFVNPPWYTEDRPERWGVRAGSRWPHYQEREAPGRLPRYVPFPFLLATSAALAKKRGHDVLLLDAVAEDMSYRNFYETVETFNPRFVFMETSTPSLASDLKVLRELQRRIPEATLCCGGTHTATLVPELMSQEKVPHYWVAGEYDESVVDLIDQLDSGQTKLVVSGLISKQRSFKGLAHVKDVNTLPQALFEQLPMQNYSDPVCGLPRPGAQVWLSRGCPFRCTFCVWPQLYYRDQEYRFRRIDDALDEVELLIGTYGCESFYFDDDTTNVGEKRMLALAAQIKQRGLDIYPWSMMARADCMRPAMIEALADAGMYSVKYGVESVSPELIDACDKGTRLDRFHDAIEKTKQAGIRIHLTIMFGIAGETLETIQETMDYLKHVQPDTVQFSICTPFPGTKYYNDCKKKGWLVTDDWSRYLGSGEAVVETPWLSARDLEFGFRKAVEEWQEFCEMRLRRQRRKLIRSLDQALTSGVGWQLLGDSDFAGFLLNCENTKITSSFAGACLDSASVEKTDSRVVIVSRHDEEKIYRRLKRDNLYDEDLVMRLYG